MSSEDETRKRRRTAIQSAVVRSAHLNSAPLPNQQIKQRKLEQDQVPQAEKLEENTSKEEFPIHESYEEALEEAASLSNVQVIMNELKKMTEDPLLKESHAPIILRHMIYERLRDRTQVDRTLDELIKKNSIRQFKLLGDVGIKDGIALIYTEDYLHCIEHLLQKACENQADAKELFDKIKTSLLPHARELTIDKKELLTLLDLKGKKEQLVNYMLKIGMLTICNSQTFYFSVPNMGDVMNQIINGRNIIVSIIKRKRFKEIMLDQLSNAFIRQVQNGGKVKRKKETSIFDELKKEKLQQQQQTSFNLVANKCLSFWFHVREMLGSNFIESINTPGGTMIALKK